MSGGLSTIKFQNLTKADKPLLDKYFRSRYYENSHFNFTNLYMWREPYHIKWCEADDILYMTCEWQGTLMALQPFGAPEKMAAATKNLIDYFRAAEKKLIITGIEKSYKEVLENFKAAKFTVTADRDNYDYVYLADKLISLSGRKLHSKKNHLNAFKKLYPDAEYLPITAEIIPDCLEQLDRWYEIRIADEPDDPFIGYERAAIREIFADFDYFKLKGGAIRLNDKIIAFTYGEQLNDDTAVVHVEKADPDIRGAYPAINQGYIANTWCGMTYINREEDMGHEGLRKAKESYKPEKMIEKFNAVLSS